SASTAGSFLRPVPAPAPLDAGSSSPTAAECARLARHGSGLRIPLRSGGPRATRSTNWCRSPELVAHASARARYAADLPDANAVCAQPVPLSSGRAVRPAGVAAPSGSLTADALPPGGPLPPEELPAATAEPRVSVAAPVPENLAELLLGFPWTDHSRRRPECHYIIQYLIVPPRVSPRSVNANDQQSNNDQDCDTQANNEPRQHIVNFSMPGNICGRLR